MRLDPDHLLVVSHPVLATILRDEIKHAIPQAQRADGWDLVEIAPLRTKVGELPDLDWAAAAATQELLFAEHLQQRIAGHARLAYFGFAPIPLAAHLGYLVGSGIRIEAYQRHHARMNWAWSPDESPPTRLAMRPLVLPDQGSTDAGPVIIRVSASHRIAPSDTDEIVPGKLCAIDVALVDPDHDALETAGALAEVVKLFNQALKHAKRMFPNLTAIHLFAAVPVGLAFRLGTQIAPTIYPEVVTYQYAVTSTPRYQAAIVLARGRGVAAGQDATKRAASPLPTREIGTSPGSSRGGRGAVVNSEEYQKMSQSEAAKHFLDQAEFRWSNPDAQEFYNILLEAYPAVPGAQMILAQSEIDKGSVNAEQSPRLFWKQALEVAAASGRLRTFSAVVLGDKQIAAYHPRLVRLVGAQGTEAPRDRAPVAWGGKELITGTQPTFLEVSFLRSGLRAAASVVQLHTVNAHGKTCKATGFLIAPDTILTNHHVLHDDDGAPVKQVGIWFNYEIDAAGRSLDVDPYEGDIGSIVGDSKDDWAIVRPKTTFKGDYPIFSLRPSKPVTVGDFVFIVQHPGGHPKKIGLLHNEVVHVTSERVQYLTDTLPGSSGAPVCNEHWQVVALHHVGIDGDPEGGASRKNQGIHINRVVEGLTARGILPGSTDRDR